VARRLKIGRSTLYRKLDELELGGKGERLKVNGDVTAA
jgi:DNA-binding NtrC family response regulator